ncbi:DHHA1 domain-containing protein [Haloferax sp. DFSO60]|uniref:DHHA1 domain-containing protein n=1 Tax=Haloferax sp. DFSO60 TaxID=3388652 RepID=UPI00397D0C03
MDGPVPELTDHAEACASRLHEADRVLLASHIDADGLTSAGVASTALERAGIQFETVFCRQLDADAVAEIAATDYETVLFTDFGSGQLDIIADHEDAGDFTPVIADHHKPAEEVETEFHLNPLRFGLNGATELSGAGASYVLARALEREDQDNRDLAALAVVGAVGDMQDTDGGLHGANAGIVAEGVEAGVVEEGTDLLIYGRQTRALPKLLQYATDVRIPGISNNEAGSIEFLTELDIDCRDDEGEWKRWVDLTGDERQGLASALMRRAIASGVPASRIDDLVGTTYVLTRETEGTELRDVSEFSTLLNATARYDRADVGLAVCLGDRDRALDRARRLLKNHRMNLSNGLQWVKEHGVRVEENLQWFDAGDEIRETIVGIVAGMAVGTNATKNGVPVLAFAENEDGDVKVSSRGSYVMVRNGLDLSAVMREASRAVGGDGGGHDVAAGATIPNGTVEEFIAEADRIVGEQLG